MPLPNERSLSAQLAERITRILEEGSTASLVTLLKSKTNAGAKLLLEETGEKLGSLGDLNLDLLAAQRAKDFLATNREILAVEVREFAPAAAAFADSQVLFERIQREPRLVICGAGHVGAALANLASVLGYRSTLIDDRSEFVTRARFPDQRIDLVAADNWSDAVQKAVSDGRGVSVAVVTRGHSEDESCLRAIMITGADYVGLIGSKRRTRIVLERLRDAGVDESKVVNVHAPIGLDIGAVTPEEVALAIMAEIVTVRRGGSGGPLSKVRR